MRTNLLLAIVLLVSAASHAQVPVAPAGNQASLLTSADPALARNKRVVFDFWREVLDAGHMELASKYLDENYIQHNPNVPTGRQGFIDVFGPHAVRKDPQQTIQRPLVSIVAEGDLVVMAFVNAMPSPKDPKQKYTTTGFDMFRVKNGKIVEHWDDFALMQMPPPQQ